MSRNIPGKIGVIAVDILLTSLLLHSAFWGKSFVAELNRISEHGERKLKLRRESMPISPSLDGAERGELTQPAVSSGIEVSQQENGLDGTSNGAPDGVNGAANGTH